ncbi:HK97 family phage prohead protease [Mycobacteroides abscessus]|jgi:HK97 family phage prohead protease|uniref:Phage prohead protease, HK97 family n=1 Tax=Mycobacteroides abscessus TaxID=36809 RepID=A0AB33T8R6_9MYCO|nr:MULTISPECIES: HK97 family phage prohead protease [Mycobacteroides]RIS93679.1 HK97 family phage prohead protease [Mycobacteroides abscessus]CPT67231.1 phage prohead protease%2C HK97 family [Mycobacteroides abscessus]CPT76865.1 phage prohead protease%2C HK97 family [Mycobacteroides abscessus]CPV17483.1 phage prohead protease%2C HK97 family [Mycobacteroides abscessus]CPW63728.1 phage prohead protease%2C HK97 family [Mycobacteroides abscessus]
MTTNTIRADRDNRKDVWEHRRTSSFEVREDSDTITLTGYASTFEPYEMYGGPDAGGWIEQLDKAAFTNTLREKPDLHLLINHEGMPLARTKSDTLQLGVDRHGLKVTAQLDRSDPDVQRLEPKMRRKDMDEMSFAFRVKGQKWECTEEFPEDNYALRTITEVSLHKGDVSVVNFGANPTTSAELKSVDQALAFLADCDPGALAEIRSDGDLLRRARAVLNSLGSIDKVAALQAAQGNARAAADAASAAAQVLQSRSENDAPKGMSLREAMARQGFASEDGSVLSLNDALAVIDR